MGFKSEEIDTDSDLVSGSSYLRIKLEGLQGH